jgi:hypothetical protein
MQYTLRTYRSLQMETLREGSPSWRSIALFYILDWVAGKVGEARKTNARPSHRPGGGTA